MFAAAAADIAVPMVEVVLTGDPEVLLARARARAGSGGVHEIKVNFSVNPWRYYEGPSVPVLDPARTVTVDTTDLDGVDVAHVAELVRGRLRAGVGQSSGQGAASMNGTGYRAQTAGGQKGRVDGGRRRAEAVAEDASAA